MLLLFSLFSANCLAEVGIYKMDIFYDSSSVPVTRGDLGFEINLHKIDSIAAIKESLVEGIPPGLPKEEVFKIIGKRIDENRARGVFGQMFNPVISAFNNEIKRIPAILINDKYLMYGVSDVMHGVQIWNLKKNAIYAADKPQ